MIAENEIEAQMRWTHGSRQAESVGRASLPNLSAGRGGEVGSRGIPVGLSAAQEPQVRYPLTETDAVGRVCTVGRSVPLPTFSFAWKTKKYGGHTT